MKLKAFRIQNFRSIVDTEFQDLSPDNISAIIGQNESGKTSILEALTAFSSDEITVDDIRNDNSSPIVTCIFSVEDGETKKFLRDDYEIPKDLERKIKSLDNCIALKKIWNAEEPSKDPILEIENAELKKYFDSLIVKDNSQDESVATESSSVPSNKRRLTPEDFASEIYHYTPAITLFEDKSLLPSTIDIADIEGEKKDIDGYIGALNFLSLTGLTPEELASHQTKERLIRDKIDIANKNISKEFQEFWSQVLGSTDKISIQAEIKNYDQGNAQKLGQPYLSFWIKDKNGNLRPAQRSMGVRWFISFFLTLKATAKRHQDRVILIDEAGANLHAKAQTDILKVLESEKDNLQIVYATHSPYLLNVDKVYRVLAVERVEDDVYKTVTKVYKFHDLGSASSDTLFPLYTNMGVDISHQQVIQKENNVLLEEISAFFYLKAFWKLFSKEEEVNFLPATGCSNIPLMANLLLGWGINFSVVADDDSHGRKVLKDLKDNHVLPEIKLVKVEECDGIEDIFTKKDFAKFVLNNPTDQIADTIKISKYIKNEKHSKPIIARDFLIKVEKGEVKREKLSQDTQNAIEILLTKISGSIQSKSMNPIGIK